MPIEQRWLSIHGICSTLNLSKSQIYTLVRKKYLVRIGDVHTNYRYLDPTPEYAERLRLADALEGRENPSLKGLFTAREVAEIMNWSLGATRHFLSKVPHVTSKHCSLYSAAQIRDFIWRRSGRKMAGRKDTVLLSELLAYFMRFREAEEEIVPTDAAFAEDAALQKKLQWMMEQPNKETMLKEFLEKMELTKNVVQQLSSGVESPSIPIPCDGA